MQQDKQFEYVDVIVSICSMLVTTFLIPFIKSKLTNEQQNKLHMWTIIAVKAAEQMFGEKTGDQKKQFVMDYLTEKGMKPDDAMIESAVHEHC